MFTFTAEMCGSCSGVYCITKFEAIYNALACLTVFCFKAKTCFSNFASGLYASVYDISSVIVTRLAYQCIFHNRFLSNDLFSVGPVV